MLLVHSAGSNYAFPRHDERNPNRFLIQNALVLQAMGSVHVAVVAGEDHERVLLEPRLLERPQHRANLAVHVFRQTTIQPSVQAPGILRPLIPGVATERPFA